MKGKCIYTTYNLFSMVLPNSFNYTRKNNCNVDEPVVIIKNGILKEGTINKAIIGSSHNSIIQILNKEYSEDIAMSFVNNVQFLAYSFILYHGFTVGISDCISTKSSKIDNVITKCFIEAKGNEETINDPRIREVKINASLSKGRDNGMKIAKDALKNDNNFISTVKSGSKGDYFNIAQITGLLGQQNLSGKRISYTLNNNTRSLPHYPHTITDKRMEYESKGFIKNSFIHGLNPREFWFHSMTGREGVTDTAMKTATSGYIQRRITKLSEDLLVNYDSTIRNSTKDIISSSVTTTELGYLAGVTSGIQTQIDNAGKWDDQASSGDVYRNSNVGIGNFSSTALTEKLEVDGNISATGTIQSTSDITLKENLEIIENPIEKIKELNGYTYNMIGKEDRHAGLVAQEVEKVLPEVVRETMNGTKSLAYGNIVALLVETVKEQQKQIDELKKLISDK